MNSFTPKLLLYRGAGVISAMIRWQTRGPYAHVALWVRDNEVLEAVQFHGVRSRPANDLDQADIYEVPSMTADQWMAAIAFARGQIGKPYDYLGVARFLSRRPERRWQESWFCSELVFAALMAANFNLLDRVAPWAVSPEMLSLSPLILPVGSTKHVSALRGSDKRVGLWRTWYLQSRASR